jgi:L-lactate utilization protein LutC
MDVEELVGRFEQELSAVGGVVHFAAESDIQLVLKQWSGSIVVVAPEDDFSPHIDRTFAAESGSVVPWDGSVRSLAEKAVVGVTGALWGVAETGSVLISSAWPGGRTPSLLPPVHLVFLRVDRLLPTTAALFRKIGEMETLPSNLVIVTGPSKSSDIGMELSTGVHGPAELHVVLVHDGSLPLASPITSLETSSEEP